MAFQQPFFEVFPVARELLSKTKRIASKSGTPVEVPTPRATSNGKLRKPPHMLKDAHSENTIRKVSTSKPTQIFVEEPESMDSSAEPPQHEKRAGHKSRPRVFSLFRRSSNTLNPLDPVSPFFGNGGVCWSLLGWSRKQTGTSLVSWFEVYNHFAFVLL